MFKFIYKLLEKLIIPIIIDKLHLEIIDDHQWKSIYVSLIELYYLNITYIVF